MRHLKTVAAAALLTFVSAAASAAPSAITQPDWLRKPSGEDLADFYPTIGATLGINGAATIQCSVNASGLLVDCQVLAEEPIGLGFGRAAILMSSKFMMRAQTLNGEPVDGGTVRIPLRFRLPDEDNPALPPPISAEAERQAYRAVDAMHPVDAALKQWETKAADIERLSDEEVPQATRQAAAKALRDAVRARTHDLRTAFAHAIATVFSEDEMAALADYYGGPGIPFRDNDAALNIQQPLYAEYRRDVAATARSIYCAKHTCGAADVQKVWRAAAPTDLKRIDNPIWAEQPTEATISAARPPVAGLLGFAGLVRLTCRLTTTGTFASCMLDEEAPAGLGFGSAGLAVAVAGGYRLSAMQLADGGAGKKVTVRIGFPAPLMSPPFSAPPGTESARVLARQLATGDQSPAIRRRDMELAIANYASRTPLGVIPRDYEAMLDALRSAVEAASDRYIENRVNLFSTSYSEADMRALLAFRASSAGKAWEKRSEELDIAVGAAVAHIGDLVMADASADFCRERDCKGLPPPQSTSVSSEPSARKP